ncbi:MAG TPA: ThuA domain-containing protein, partial [Phycisphaerae bacterium]|nr:ThuA domain-containing protein [Phycisphaerae bacterium]
PYEVPIPEAVIFAGVYNDATELARDGLVWTVGKGRIFYFRPGHETFPIFHNPSIQKVIANAARWMAPAKRSEITVSHRKEIGWFEK